MRSDARARDLNGLVKFRRLWQGKGPSPKPIVSDLVLKGTPRRDHPFISRRPRAMLGQAPLLSPLSDEITSGEKPEQDSPRADPSIANPDLVAIIAGL